MVASDIIFTVWIAQSVLNVYTVHIQLILRSIRCSSALIGKITDQRWRPSSEEGTCFPGDIQDILCGPQDIIFYEDFPIQRIKIVDADRRFRSAFIDMVEAIIHENENDEREREVEIRRQRERISTWIEAGGMTPGREEELGREIEAGWLISGCEKEYVNGLRGWMFY